MLTPKLLTSETLPKAMMWSVYLSSVLGLVMILTMCFALGDLNSILASSTGYPFIQIYYNAIQTYSGTNFMVAIPIILLICACIAEVATASRQLWSFARDKGPPFSSALARVSPSPAFLYIQTSAEKSVRSNRPGISHSTPSYSPSSSRSFSPSLTLAPPSLSTPFSPLRP